MKKVVCCILFILPLILFGQDSTEIAYAKKIKQAIENRPNPKMFTEQEALEVLAGEKVSSKTFTIEYCEVKYIFWEKCSIKKESYSRSVTASQDGWWYTYTHSYNDGEWKLNWPFFLFTMMILTAIISLIFLIKFYRRMTK